MKKKPATLQPSAFDFTRSISQLFTQPGGLNFTIRLVLWSSVFFAALFGVFAKPLMEFFGAILQTSWATQHYGQSRSDVLEMYKNMLQYVPAFLPFYLGLWAVYASAETALHKRIFKNIDQGFLPLRFGRDELRVMYVQFMVMLMMFGVMILGILILFLTMLVAFASSGVLSTILVIVGFVVYIGALVYSVYFVIRMAPSAALSIYADKIKITGGWAITRKRTLALFGTYVFIYIIGYVVVGIVHVMLFSMVFEENYMLVMMGLSETSPEVFFATASEALKQPGTMVGLILGGILYIIALMTWWLSMAGAGNFAVQWWDEDRDENVF